MQKQHYCMLIIYLALKNKHMKKLKSMLLIVYLLEMKIESKYSSYFQKFFVSWKSLMKQRKF